MQSLTVFEVLKQVIFSWQVIAITVALVLYLNLVFFVSRRHHRPLKIHRISFKKKKAKEKPEDSIEVTKKSKSGSSVNDELGLEEE